MNCTNEITDSNNTPTVRVQDNEQKKVRLKKNCVEGPFLMRNDRWGNIDNTIWYIFDYLCSHLSLPVSFWLLFFHQKSAQCLFTKFALCIPALTLGRTLPGGFRILKFINFNQIFKMIQMKSKISFLYMTSSRSFW